MITRNDEATYEDELGHFTLVRQVAETVQYCEPPFVVGVCGSWGSGKTSFIRKLEIALGGEPEATTSTVPLLDSSSSIPGASARTLFRIERDAAKQQEEEFLKRKKTYIIQQLGDGYVMPGLKNDGTPDDEALWQLVRFNPWHHQFEETPVVALLQEIRRNLSLKHKAWSEAGKIFDVAVHAGLSMIGDVVKAAAVVTNPANLANPMGYSAPNFNTKSIIERGVAYEDENYLSLLSSQRFRDAFETAIKLVTGPRGRIVIFIDDLDRCEGDVAFKLLESLKLHLNARNCIYILGIDQGHLVETVARSLRGDKADEDTAHWHARNYLDKLFQTTFLLPVPQDVKSFINSVLCSPRSNPEDALSLDDKFNQLLVDRFGWEPELHLQELIEILDQNLPHNPRKIKAFIASWKLNLRQLDAQLRSRENVGQRREDLYWKTSLILNYLAFFEEPIFRRIERDPSFYFSGLQFFCQSAGNISPMPLELDRLILTREAIAALTSADSIGPEARQEEVGKRLRPLHIARLVNDLSKVRVMNNPVTAERAIRRHLLATNGTWIDDVSGEGTTEVARDSTIAPISTNPSNSTDE